MNNRTIIIAVFILLVILPQAAGLGVSPGKSTLNFVPGRVETIQMDVINSDLKELEVVIYVDGELKDYITTSEKMLEFKEDEYKKSFNYTISMPASLEKPGKNTAEITVTESASEVKKGITASIGISSVLFVNVPYPELYAEATIKAKDVKKGEDLPFYINIYNLGNEPIKNASVQLDIYSADGKLYKTLKAESLSIVEKKYGELVMVEKTDEIIPGKYYINATIKYDGKTIYLPSEFSVTDFLIQLKSMYVDGYRFGGVASFSIIVQNIGNRIVDDFFSMITLNDANGNFVANTRSLKSSIGAQDAKKTYAFWDTKDISEGDYYGKISLNYEGQSVEKDIKTTILGDKIDVKVITPITGMVIREEQPAATDKPMALSNNSPMLILLVIVIIALIAVATGLIRRKNKHSSEDMPKTARRESSKAEKEKGNDSGKEEKIEELKEKISEINKEMTSLMHEAKEK